MKKQLLYFFLFLVTVGNAQDTIIYNDFSIEAYDPLIIEGDTFGVFNVKNTIKSNLELQNWQTISDYDSIHHKVINPVVATNYKYYDSAAYNSWHIHVYLEDSIDTIVENDTTIYDTLTNKGIASYSWLEEKRRISNAFMLPTVEIHGESILRWKSMPMQGPRYQDGYKVFILETGYNTLDLVQFANIDYVFAMKELDVTQSGVPAYVTSLAELMSTYDFVPSDGVMHENYELKDTTEAGIVDSTIQQPYMQEFEIDLTPYIGKDIQVIFMHDSYDNYGIVFDDILIAGDGFVSSKEIKKGVAQIFPNPVRDLIFAEVPDTYKKAIIEIYDVKGSLVFANKYRRLKGIDVSSFKNGQYVLKLQTEKTVYTQSFIKTK